MATERNCPDCGDTLPFQARACQCGWRQANPHQSKAPALPPEYFEKSDEKASRDATAYLAARGLTQQLDETREQWMQRMSRFRKERAKLIGSGGVRIREPGDDDQDVAA